MGSADMKRTLNAWPTNLDVTAAPTTCPRRAPDPGGAYPASASDIDPSKDLGAVGILDCTMYRVRFRTRSQKPALGDRDTVRVDGSTLIPCDDVFYTGAYECGRRSTPSWIRTSGAGTYRWLLIDRGHGNCLSSPTSSARRSGRRRGNQGAHDGGRRQGRGHVLLTGRRDDGIRNHHLFGLEGGLERGITTSSTPPYPSERCSRPIRMVQRSRAVAVLNLF